jgi:hypothetical protein
MKLCKNCVHYVAAPSAMSSPMCSRISFRDPVDGNTQYHKCWIERTLGECGESGKFYTPAPTSDDIPF